MDIAIRTRQIDVNEDLRQHVERSIEFAIDRHKDRIERISVILGDLNGPRGGIDKVCQIIADMRGARPVVILEKGFDLQTIVSRAAKRLAYRVGRRVNRQSAPHQREYRGTIRAA